MAFVVTQSFMIKHPLTMKVLGALGVVEQQRSWNGITDVLWRSKDIVSFGAKSALSSYGNLFGWLFGRRPTMVETAFIFGTVSYGIWKCSNGFTIPNWSWWRYKITGTVVRRIGGASTSQMVYECYRPGSEEAKYVPFKGQLEVGDLDAEQFVVKGGGIRFYNVLVTPEHVLAQCSNPAVKGKTGTVYLRVDDAIVLDTDLLAFRLNNDEWSVIGGSEPPVCSVIPELGIEVKVVGVGGLGTMGTLKINESLFGRVVYSGTTRHGYSGAAYVSGNRVVGMHTNGGTINGGYSAGYIRVLIRSLVLPRDHPAVEPEDTYDFLKGLKNKKKKVWVDKRWRGLDDVRVYTNGSFGIVSQSDMRRVYGDDWWDSLDDYGSLQVKEPVQYTGESVTSSLNVVVPQSSGASNTLGISTPSTPKTQRVKPKELLPGFSQEDLRLMIKKAVGAQISAVNVACYETLKQELYKLVPSTAGQNSAETQSTTAS